MVLTAWRVQPNRFSGGTNLNPVAYLPTGSSSSDSIVVPLLEDAVRQTVLPLVDRSSRSLS